MEALSGVWLCRTKHCHGRCLKKINHKWICKNKEAYSVVVTMAQKIKTDKIWLCESIGKLKGIGKQVEVKMNEINIHTIADLQRYVWSCGLTKLPIRGLGRFYEHALVALPGKPTPSIKDHRKAKNPYFSIYAERWVEKLKLSSSINPT